MTITEFIEARLAERETAVRAEGEGLIAWLTYLLPDGSVDHATVAAADSADGPWCAAGELLPARASVLIVHDHDGALREVAAMRAMVDEVFRYEATIDGAWDCHSAQQIAEGLCPDRQPSDIPALRAIAAIWDDHPDYQPQWGGRRAEGIAHRRAGLTMDYPPGCTDDLADRLTSAAERLHVREISDPPAFLGHAIAVADMVRELDEMLSTGAPMPRRWAAAREPGHG